MLIAELCGQKYILISNRKEGFPYLSLPWVMLHTAGIDNLVYSKHD